MKRLLAASICLLLTGWLTGCGSASAPEAPSAKGGAASGKSSPGSTPDSRAKTASNKKAKPQFEAVALGNASATTGGAGGASNAADKSIDSVVEAMQPLQIMLGKWRGTTSLKVKGFSKVEELEWIWDFRTDKAQPALVVKAEKGAYIRDGRLTFLTDKQAFRFVATSPTGIQHVMHGTFEREPEEFTGDDNKPQRTYKLVLTEDDPGGDEAWQVAFDQQENNRYLVQLSRKREKGSFQPVDTVGTQRVGTSFAMSDDDYGEKKCVISGGLGTSTVSYHGKTYWVCCSGCQAAFNEDPARWIAKKEAADKAKADKN